MMSSLIGKLFYFRPRYSKEVKKPKKKDGKVGKSGKTLFFRKEGKKEKMKNKEKPE